MPMNRSLYPADWDTIAHQVKAAADWKCQKCGKQCYRPGEKALDRRKVLTVHHEDHDPGNSDRNNLKALCAPCHLREEVRCRVWRTAHRMGQMILPGMEAHDDKRIVSEVSD